MLKRQNFDSAFIIRLTPYVSFYMIPGGWINTIGIKRYLTRLITEKSLKLKVSNFIWVF